MKEETMQNIEYLPDQVYYAARDGMAMSLCALLESMSQDDLKAVLVHKVCDEIGQECTPLLIAAKNGHEKVVKLFMNKFPIDLEQEGCVKIDNYLVNGASALWCAAASGHLNVVKTLVRAGADINHPTMNHSSPLRAACFDGRLDIVKYLVEHGADFNKVNQFNNSCLMIAAYKGHLEIVKFLLEVGADADQRALCGATAMHFAAECGQVDIVRELLKYGAKITSNEYGLTPLLAAAERTRLGVVEFLVKQDSVSIESRIEALELLGASFANDKDSYSLELAYLFMKRAMELRYKDPNNIIYKPKFDPIPAYNNRVECQSLEDLEKIKDDTEELHMESLTIRERILGQHNPDVPHSVVYRGAVFADNSKFDRCIMLWMHALKLSQMNNVSAAKDLIRFSQVFSQMVSNGLAIEFEYIRNVLSAAVLELKRNKEKIKKPSIKDDVSVIKDEMESNLLVALYVIVLVTKLRKRFSDEEEFMIRKLIYQLIATRSTNRYGQTLLHLCVDSDTPVDTFHIIEVCNFPSAEATKLLITCGADVNAMDDFYNTPLHVVAGFRRSASHFSAVNTIIADLVKANAHLDYVNANGKTPIEESATVVVDVILRSHMKPSLKCTASKVVHNYEIPYVGQVPKDLEKFIKHHGIVSDTSNEKKIESESSRKKLPD